MNKLLLAKYNLNKFILFLVPYILVVIAINVAFSILINGEDNEWIPYNIVYCDEKDLCEQYADENQLNYYLSPSILDANLYMSDTVVMKQKLADLTYTKEASSVLIERNLDYMNKENNQWIESKLRYNYYPEIMNEINISNQGLDIEYIIEGEYPNEPREVLIPEYYAQVLLTKNKVSDYNNLIDNEIELELSNETNNTNSYSISGVYAGGYDFIFDQQLDAGSDDNVQLTSMFLEFSSTKERQLFFREFDKKEVIDTSDISLVMRSYYIFYPIIKFILATLGIYISYKILKRDVWSINFYKWRLENVVLPLIVPIFIVILTVYIIDFT